jgi:hypothetical protein
LLLVCAGTHSLRDGNGWQILSEGSVLRHYRVTARF